MRVGIVAYGLDRGLSGIGRYTVELANALSRLPGGPEVVVFDTDSGRAFKQSSRLTVRRLRFGRWLPMLLTIGGVEIVRAARMHSLDLVHLPGPFVPLSLVAKGDTRWLVTIHDIIPLIYPETHARLTNLLHRWWLPIGIKYVDRILTDSQHSRSDIQTFLRVAPEKVTGISLGIRPEFQAVNDSERLAQILEKYGIRRPYILAVGSIEPRKNLERLLVAFRRIAPQLEDHQLVLAGLPRWKSASITDLCLDERVVLAGYIDDVDLPAIYSAARLLVYPSLYEGFGFPPLEAMACGTPVVASNTSSLPEILDDVALLVDPHDIGALASAILQVLGSYELRVSMIREGKQWAGQFTWENTARLTSMVYKETLDGVNS